ncbi:MAG: hypothetical protein KF870_16740 [Leadbetterella sp.]|nr:hypothetical protein [Leadbetterella sp.]
MSKYRILLLCVFVGFKASSQVLDDSTRQIYSNKTVEFFYENDILRNINRAYHPDSSLKNYHISSPLRLSGWLYQDLGNVGTASRSLLFEKNTEAGQQMGMESFRLYAPRLADFKYYNTRSPYTYLGFQQGGGHTQFQVTHSQNINPRLNLTLNIFKFNSEKQYGYLRSEDVLVNHWRYDISGNYISKNKKYRLLATFYHFNHKHFEQGGISGGDTLTLKKLERKYSRNYDAALGDGIFNQERWNNFHLYQQFLMKNSLQTFHTLDYERKFYSFEDPAFTDSTSALVYRIPAPKAVDTLNYHYRFQTISNKFGFKGLYKGFNYQVYAKARFYKLTNTFYPSFAEKWQPEFFAGGLLGYVFPDSTNTLDVKAEIGSYKNYLLDATLFYKGFEIGFYNSATPAGLFYQKFSNGVINYKSKLDPVNSKHLSVRFPLPYRAFSLVPEARWASIKNYTFLKDVDEVGQSDRDINLFTLALNAGFHSKNFDARYKLFFNTTSDATVYPIPKQIHTANLEFNFLYAHVLRIYTGVDMYLNSRYHANYYSPLVNHFIAVQRQETGGVALVDLYIKFPISKGRIALNWQFMNKGWTWKGVFTTPGYVGQPGALMIKIDWPLFD